MPDSTQKRAAMIEHLEAAQGVASEIGDNNGGFLIERALETRRVAANWCRSK
jgi:hypothetical protein